MAADKERYVQMAAELADKQVTLIAVSKTKPADEILELYHLGQRDFGENYVQELTEKEQLLPKDIRWHFIGHLQTNKVKLIAPFVHLIHGVDSGRLLEEINKQGRKNNRVIDILLQLHISNEETKYGLTQKELNDLINAPTVASRVYVRINGLMGMASFTGEEEKLRQEFRVLKAVFDQYKQVHTPNFNLRTLSMGMSSDYKIAIAEGSTMVRIGSLLFGAR